MLTFFLFAFIFTLLFLALDVAVFYFRRKKYGEGQPLADFLQGGVEQVENWLRTQAARLRVPKIAPRLPASLPAAIPAAHFAQTVSPALTDPALAGQPVSQAEPTQPAESAQQVTATLRQVPAPANGSADGGSQTVHIQVSADVPVGMVVHVILEVVDSQGKSTVQVLESQARPAQVAAKVQEREIPAKAPASKPAAILPQVEPVRPIAPEKKSLPAGKLAAFAPLAMLIQYFQDLREDFAASAEKKSLRLQGILLATAVIAYALIVSIGIGRYPIYFFTDEAIHMNLVSDFLRDDLTNYYGEFLPTFFSVEGWVNGTSVYAQLLPLLLFGKSVVVTRLVSAFISLLGALSAALLLRDVLKLKFYWVGIFLVLVTPAWFLHARTAFEYVEVASFYSMFLYFYGRYREGHLRSLYWAIVAAALAFYTHGLGQILTGVTGLMLFLVDIRYHLHPDRRKTILNGLLLVAILLLPFVRYYIAHPGEAAAQVKRRGSYWTDGNLTTVQKMGEFFGEYIKGLSPAYWYTKNNIDLSRHIMNGYGNGLWYTFPFLLLGLLRSLKNIRLPSYRIVLIALLACPIPASVVAIGMPRMLWMTFPAALLTAIGLITILQWLEDNWKSLSTSLAVGTFILLAGLGIYMLRDALVNGSTWIQDYGLYGMQYGAQQIFGDVVRQGLEEDPDRRYIVSPSWANGTEQFVAFFIPKELLSQVSMGQPINFIDDLRNGTPNMYFVATANEYRKLRESQEFKDIQVQETIPYPNGEAGFYVITLKVADNIEQIIAAEQTIRRQPVENTLELNGQNIRVLHSPLGSGRLLDIFDDNPDSLGRVLEANPFFFDLTFKQPIPTHSVFVKTGSLPNFTLTISLYAPGATEPVTYTETYQGLPPDPEVTLEFPNGPEESARITIEIKDNNSGESSQIHVRTIQFK